MAEHKTVYRWSQDYAKKYGELEWWRESYKENCTCARAIEKAINENYKDNRLDTDSAQGIIAEYGWNRVQWVLANTIQQHADDGRFSPKNKEWAEGFYMPEDDNLWHYSVEAHPGLVNMFVDRVQKEWQALGLFDRTHCTDEGDYEDKLIVLKPSSLKDQYNDIVYRLLYKPYPIFGIRQGRTLHAYLIIETSKFFWRFLYANQLYPSRTENPRDQNKERYHPNGIGRAY